MRERRCLERFTLKLPAWIRSVSGTALSPEIKVQTKDISSGGAFFSTEKKLPLGCDQEVEVDLSLPVETLEYRGGKRSVMRVTGSVLRVEELGIALKFVSSVYMDMAMQSGDVH